MLTIRYQGKTIMKLVLMLGAMYIKNYDFESLLDDAQFKLIILAGEHAVNTNKEIFIKHGLEHYIIPKYYNSNPMAEAFIEDALIQKIEQLIHNWQGEISIYCDSEVYMLIAGKMRTYFKLDGPDDNYLLKFKNKLVMKNFLLDNHVELPKFAPFSKYLEIKGSHNAYQQICHDLNNQIFIIKPSNMAGANGFVKIDSFAKYNIFLTETYSPKIEYIVETFISGDLFHVDGVVKNGIIITNFVCEYTVPNAEMLNGYILGSIPLASTSKEYLALFPFTKNLVENIFCLKNSAFHLELFYDRATTKINFLEIGHRPPGGSIYRVYVKNYKYNIFHHHFLVSCALASTTIDLSYDYDKINYMVCKIPTINGQFLGVKKPKTLLSKFSVESNFKIGEHMSKAVNIGGVAAIFQLYNESTAELLQDFNKLKWQKLLITS